MTQTDRDEPILVGQIRIDYLIDQSASGGVGMFEMTVPPGAPVPPPHSHAHNDECVYVLEGTLRYSVDGVTRDLAPGEHIYSPRGSVHAFSNPADVPAKALSVLTPDIGAQYFRDVGGLLGAGGPPDKAKLMAVMMRYGLTPAAPSPQA